MQAMLSAWLTSPATVHGDRWIPVALPPAGCPSNIFIARLAAANQHISRGRHPTVLRIDIDELAKKLLFVSDFELTEATSLDLQRQICSTGCDHKFYWSPDQGRLTALVWKNISWIDYRVRVKRVPKSPQEISGFGQACFQVRILPADLQVHATQLLPGGENLRRQSTHGLRGARVWRAFFEPPLFLIAEEMRVDWVGCVRPADQRFHSNAGRSVGREQVTSIDAVLLHQVLIAPENGLRRREAFAADGVRTTVCNQFMRLPDGVSRPDIEGNGMERMTRGMAAGTARPP